MQFRIALVAVAALLGLVFATPGTANAVSTGSAGVSNAWGRANASWTWSGPGSLTNISLNVYDGNCNGNPVYAYFKVTRSNGGVWYTGTHRYDHKGCFNGGTSYTGLSLSDTYNIKYVAIRLCNDGVFNDCTTGSNSGANPYA